MLIRTPCAIMVGPTTSGGIFGDAERSGGISDCARVSEISEPKRPALVSSQIYYGLTPVFDSELGSPSEVILSFRDVDESGSIA